MHAVLVNVTIAPGQFDASRKVLNDQVVPRVKQMHGLVKGYWTVRDDTQQGTSMAVFQTKQDADAAMTTIRSSPPPPGVTINSIEVREIVAES